MADTQEQEQEVEQKPIDKWDASAVKNRLDDAVKYYFTNDLKYTENFLLIDLRLTISSAAVGVATFALIWDYLNPFPASRTVLLSCVLAYFAFMVLLTLYTTLVEKGTFLKATLDKNKYITVSSYMKRFDDLYTLYVEYSIKGKGLKQEGKIENTVAKWFDDEGYFLEKRFETDLKNMFSNLQKHK